MTTADLDLARAIPTITDLRLDPDTTASHRVEGDSVVEITLESPYGLPGIHLEVELGAAAAYWYADQDTRRTLPPDWMPPRSTSLVRSAPVGVLYGTDGMTRFGWAASEAVAELEVTAGVSEERKTFVVEVRPAHPLSGPLVLRLDAAGGPLARAVARLGAWISDGLAGSPMAVPAVAERPVYSTWYTFTQDVDAAVVESEAALAASLGCGSVFIDDGWQRLGHGRGYGGCGDWVPDLDKFPDLPGTIARLRELDVSVALWIAPLLLGKNSDVAADLTRFAPHEDTQNRCRILDPRYAEVREHLAATCVRLVTEYGADALKIDFLDTAMVYRGTESGGDLADVGEAMGALLAEIRRQLAVAGRPDVAFEFRQPYVSPAIARYSQILRAGDCPADALANRRETVDARLLSVGQVVHSDPMMWGPTGGAEAVAQQLYAGWFSVPQISMRLSDLDPVQSAALGGLLALWSSTSEICLHGELELSGAEIGYDQVRSTRADLGRSVVAAYGSGLVEVGTVSETIVLNATTADRLVVATTAPVRRVVVRNPSGHEIEQLTGLAVGLHEVDVPEFGSLEFTA